MMVTNLLRLVTRSALAACLLVPQIRDMVIADPPQRPTPLSGGDALVRQAAGGGTYSMRRDPNRRSTYT